VPLHRVRRPRRRLRVRLPARVARVRFSAAVRSSSAPVGLVVLADISHVLAGLVALLVSSRAVARCTPHAPRPPALLVAGPALVRVRVVPAAGPVLVRALARAVLVASFRLRVRLRVHSARVVRHAAVDGSSTRRPRKAR
jgi:hypothetical protein